MSQDIRIIFMGTPEFAVPSLNMLLDNGYNVVGVITQPDKPQGRKNIDAYTSQGSGRKTRITCTATDPPAPARSGGSGGRAAS